MNEGTIRVAVAPLLQSWFQRGDRDDAKRSGVSGQAVLKDSQDMANSRGQATHGGFHGQHGRIWKSTTSKMLLFGVTKSRLNKGEVSETPVLRVTVALKLHLSNACWTGCTRQGPASIDTTDPRDAEDVLARVRGAQLVCQEGEQGQCLST